MKGHEVVKRLRAAAAAIQAANCASEDLAVIGYHVVEIEGLLQCCGTSVTFEQALSAADSADDVKAAILAVTAAEKNADAASGSRFLTPCSIWVISSRIDAASS